MRFLDKLDLLLTEEKEQYNLFPVDYDLESGVSFGVEYIDTDKVISRITVKTIDGNPIDALNGNYDPKDIYVDVVFTPDIEGVNHADLMLWVLNKFQNMGFDQKNIRFDGDRYTEKPEVMSDITTDDDEPVESDTPFDISSYWVVDDDEDNEKE